MQERRRPQRQCVGCRESKDKRELIRVVKTPENTFVLDETGRISGRGAYLCKSAECLLRAKKNNALNRSFRTKVSDEIYEALERQLQK